MKLNRKEGEETGLKNVKSKKVVPKLEMNDNVVEKDSDRQLNVMDFGAIGDGITDDTIAIQKCFNSVNDKGVIYIPSGTYMVSGLKISGKKEVTIKGNGERSIIKLKNNSSNKYVLGVEDCPRFIFEYITIDGNKVNEKEENPGIVVSRSEYSKIQNCNIKSCKGNGVELRGVIIKDVFQNTNGMKLINNYIEGNTGHGVWIDSVLDAIISENYIQFNTLNGIKITQTTKVISANISISNNQVLSNDVDGIEIDNGCSRIILSSNNIRNNGRYGLRWVEGKQLFVVGNNFHINGRINVSVPAVIIGYNTKGFFIGNTFSCTDFDPTQLKAIEMYSSKKIYLMGNDVDDNQQTGIYIDPDSECYCYGNDIIADTTNYSLSNVYMDTDNTKGNKIDDTSAATGKVFCGSIKEGVKLIDGNAYKCKHLVYNILLRCKISNNLVATDCLSVKVNGIKIGCLTGRDFPLSNMWFLREFIFDASNSNTLKVTVETQSANINANVCVEYVLISPRI